MRYVLALVLIALTFSAWADEDGSQLPNGHDLLRMSPGAFQSYVSGIIEGQMLLAKALRMPQAICIDPILTRTDVAELVALGLTELPEVFLALPRQGRHLPHPSREDAMPGALCGRMMSRAARSRSFNPLQLPYGRESEPWTVRTIGPFVSVTHCNHCGRGAHDMSRIIQFCSAMFHR